MYEEMKKTVKESEHEYRYIGKHGNRADADDLVSGRQKFLDDLVMPGMLVIRVLRSPYANAIIKSIDLKKAKALPGVIGVASYREAPDWKCGLPNHRRVLDQRVRFVGDSVALVAAETETIADEALELIDVEYEVLPFVLDCEEALKPGAPQLYEEYPGNEIPKVTPFSEEPFNQIFVGDTKKGFEEADYVNEGYMKYENMAHPLPPESPGCIAQWTGPNAVTVWYNGGAPHLQKFNTEASIAGVVVRAANDARRQLLEMAAVKLNANVEDLDTENFLVFAKSRPEVRLPWIAVCGTPEMTITGSAKYKQNFDKPNFALYLADVEVNLMTGEAKLIHALEGSDVGQIIDPINIRMQAEGSFGSAGGDTGLFEEMVMDKKLGRFMTGNMIDYKWRTFNEFPPFDTVLLESEFDSEAFHALGFGEITPSPAPAAILMAVSNAIGHEITEYPCSPTVVLRAMGKIK